MLGEGAQDEEAEHKVYLSDSVPSLLPHVPPDVPVTYKHLFSTNFEPANPLRVIAHCDVDAAYAQFEASRLKLDSKVSPLAVLQWSSLPGDVEPKHYENPNPKTHKISLDMYRRESKKIMDIFQRRVNSGATTGVRTQFDLNPAIADCWTPMPLELLDEHEGQDILFEKASIDESFFDLSVYARKQILHRFPYLDTRAELENMSPDARAKKLECFEIAQEWQHTEVAKNFQPALTDTAHALRWLSIMSAELSVRLQEERETFPLAYPRSIVLRYFVYGALGARSVQLPFGFVSNDALASEIFHKAEKLWKQGVGEQLSAGASVATLSLSFSGIERQSRDQKQLDVFFKALSPRKKARIAPETHTGTATTPSDHEALETSQIEFANEKIAELAPVQRAASTQQSVLPTAAYDTYKDHETQTEMIQWRCSRCSNIIAIPIFDDLVDETPDTNQPSYQILLDRLREEHRNWHMAVDLAAELVDTPQ
ncbi:Rad30p [Malassezia vespertilionis]|uniref:Rad30p n=1 Tax=Malassezia vespertilionis TaxID=2020962 RepID=A0A2N1JA31_9BASI|nr:Rad30p [Malassezia vespertilionis]